MNLIGTPLQFLRHFSFVWSSYTSHETVLHSFPKTTFMSDRATHLRKCDSEESYSVSQIFSLLLDQLSFNLRLSFNPRLSLTYGSVLTRVGVAPISLEDTQIQLDTSSFWYYHLTRFRRLKSEK